MANPDTQKILKQVEDQTSYRVVLGTTDKAVGDAEMVAAAPGHPVHLINVSNRSLQFSDYIVAVQCSMILIMWSHPEGIPEFRPNAAMVSEAAIRAASFPGLAKLPRRDAEQMGQLMVNGLLHQLLSTPSELLAIEYCFNECPSLHALQAEVMNASLRRNSGSLKPEIRETTPPDIFENSQTMCAALARYWCGVIGSKIPMLPYLSLGIEDRANLLLHKFIGATGTLGQRSVSTVNGWADELGLRSMYQWTFRKKQL